MEARAMTRHLLIGLLGAFAAVAPQARALAQSPPRPSVFQTTLEEPGQLTPEITTEELLSILATKSMPVFDVRTAREYAIAHIPGTINVFELEVERIATLYPDRSQPMVLYCNGPSCGKSKRTSEQLVALGYTNVRRYQLGMPVWRALSQTVQTDLPGADYIYRGDRTAVWVDARTPAEHAVETVTGAVNIQKGEATAANDDGRLPFTDKGTRVVVFGNTVDQARVVAAEIAKKAYWNSSYFGGTFNDLLVAGFVNHPPVAISRDALAAAGAACTASIHSDVLDNGSFDPDSGDVLTLSLDPAGPFALGLHTISLVATDSHGSSSAASSRLTVTDQSAPVIGDLAVDKPVISERAGRGMELVTVSYTAADNCGPVTAELVVSTDGVDERGPRDGRRAGFEVIDANHVLLSTDREGRGDRVFTIAVVASDGAGNRSTASTVVRVASR
jgi:rhodanese-related sulfurtransferase